jgi:hypothetical protein
MFDPHPFLPESHSLVVVCLQCGERRRSRITETGHLTELECLRCGYLGWRPPVDQPQWAGRRAAQAVA